MQELNTLSYQFDKLNLIKNSKNVQRQPYFLQKIIMPWEIKQQYLFQFKEIYSDRIKNIRQAFNNQSVLTVQLLGVNSKTCQLIGLFKRIQKNRVRAFEPEYQEKYKNNKPLFSENDLYELQDQTGKVKLEIKNSSKIDGKEKFNPLEMPYGVIVKCKGQYNSKTNRFVISNIQTPQPPPQSSLRLNCEAKSMVVMCQPTLAQIKKFQIDLAVFSSEKFLELVIIGFDYKNRSQWRQFDEYILQISTLIDVFILPSVNQNQNCLYPQDSHHESFLQKSYKLRNVSNCANPQMLRSRYNDLQLKVLISCGENLLNLKANCSIQDEMKLMKLLLDWRHLCPSSVFSLATKSYNYDPLILQETPHLMIHGKCQKFCYEFYEYSHQKQKIACALIGLAKGDIIEINLGSKLFEAKFFEKF